MVTLLAQAMSASAPKSKEPTPVRDGAQKDKSGDEGDDEIVNDEDVKIALCAVTVDG